MSTHEALLFLGLDHYATASDIKAAHRRLSSALRPDAAMDDQEWVCAAESRRQLLDRAYAALRHRVDHTPPDEDELAGVEGCAKPKGRTAGLHVIGKLKLGMVERLRQLRVRAAFLGAVRAVAVFAVMLAVGYGIVRGAAAKHLALGVVDAKTDSGSRPEPVPPVPAARATAREKAVPAGEKRSPVVAAAPRPLRAPALPSLDASVAKAIGSVCLAKTGDKADEFNSCVLETARETPQPIHLE